MAEKKINLSLTEAQFIRLVKETDIESWLWPILEDKIHAMERRDAFTKYRKASSDEEKADARAKYLSLKQ